MKKGYYIASGSGWLGVNLKIKNQCSVLNNFFDVECLHINKKKTNIIKSILWRMPFGSYGVEYTNALTSISDPDFLYIRSQPVDRAFLKFIKHLRQRCPNGKLVLEVATYPYAKELLCDREMWPFYFKDAIYHRKLNKYVDRIVTYSDDEFIFGIPTIRTKNGINVSNVDPIQNTELDDTIDLLAVAMFQKYHGYERIIKGMQTYYASEYIDRKIILHMVGEGKELGYYKRLVAEAGLEEYVIFYGKKQGEELDKLYENMDIALGAFGYYKMGYKYSSMLKIRQYLSKGLPIISGCREDVFEENPVSFYLQFENNSSDVDMGKIVSFYDRVYAQGQLREDIIDEIRKYAFENVDMKVVMRPVIEYLEQ